MLKPSSAIRRRNWRVWLAVKGGPEVIEVLRKAAIHAKWFGVAAPPYHQAIPASGAAEALEDMQACRTRWTAIEGPERRG